MVTTPLIPDWLARLYPFKPTAFITPRGARMNYVDHGPRRDDAVLLLHGNPTWSFYYRDLVRDLAAAGLRCIAPDHVGMGLSEKPPDYDYTLATRIADLEALVGALGLKRVHLVVHDWGGAIGFGFAARHPDLIGRVVILNSAAFPANHIPMRIALCSIPLLGPLIVRGCNGFAGPATSMAMRRRILMPDEKRGYLFPYDRSEEHTSELQSRQYLVCRLLLEKKKKYVAPPIAHLDYEGYHAIYRRLWPC